MGTKLRRGATVALFTGLLFVVGVAFASWLASGSGQGYARAGTAGDLATLEASASAIGDLYPGGTGGLYLTIDNPNPYPVAVTSVTGAGTITSDTVGCHSPGHGITFTDQLGLSLAVPAGSSAQHVLAGAVAMAADSDPDCEGATFTIPVALTGTAGDGTTGGSDDPTYTYYEDLDGDGWGSTTQVESTSETPPSGTATQSGDCDDTSPGVNPAATEIWNGIDDDCDGQIDEGLDTDGDGLEDAWEEANTVGGDVDGDGLLAVGDTDSDGDGFTDGEEGMNDTDADGTYDFEDIDSDDDGRLDGPGDSLYVDSDGDGVPDIYDADS